MNELDVDYGLIEEIASRLDLREPNVEAVRSIAVAVADHYDRHGEGVSFEGVVDVATGVGKTYIMAGAMEYFAARGHRHFAVIAPGSTILAKTLRNFTLGDSKSLLRGMSMVPELITAENFDSPAVSFQMGDAERVKLYVFTVQSLIKPTSRQGRRTHDFREGLGDAFYRKLSAESGLIVFADEHHTYYGPAFSRAVRDMKPYALVGLTATPHDKTPRDRIIYRYPLAAAIADRFVKTPVIVGRRDDRHDDETKLADGAHLLELKRKVVERYLASEGGQPFNPVMLVLAPSIAKAEEYAALLERPLFMDGRYRGRVLTVHSDQGDAALADLDKVEDPASPVRIIVAVGMLKEGWDVKNVYVIVSMRASVSEILTEQTLGRGLRLPFGAYTGIEMLDTLEVVAHEQYEKLLKKAEVLREEFVNHRTLLALRREDGALAAIRQEVPVEVPVHVRVAGGRGASGREEAGGIILIEALDERRATVERQAEESNQLILPREGAPVLWLPVVRMTPVKAEFSLADVDPNVFLELGKKHSADPDTELLRTVLSAEAGEDAGRQWTRLVTRPAEDRVDAVYESVDLEESLRRLRLRLSGAEEVPARASEMVYLDVLLDAYVRGLGDKAQAVLAAYLDRAALSFRRALGKAQRELEARPQYEDVVEFRELKPERMARSEASQDREGRFRRGVGYEGWARSYFPQVWFDSEPEFLFAGVADQAKEVKMWVRLLRNDVPILWRSGGSVYNPDFLVILKDGTHIIVEIKAEKATSTAEVQEKRKAAERWVRRASAQGTPWAYWLVTDQDIKNSHRSWGQIRAAAESPVNTSG